MLTNDQIEKRYSGIGGSEAAAVIGLSSYATPLSVYLDKKERRQKSSNSSMYWGNLLEPIIRQEYANQTKSKVTINDALYYHPQHQFMIGNIDGIVNDEKLLEIKTTKFEHGWGDIEHEEIPIICMIQVQHYLSILAFEMADVAVLIGASDFRIYPIKANKDLQEMIIEGERIFWENFEKNIAPQPISFDEIIETYKGKSQLKSMKATENDIKTILELKEIKEQIATLKTKEEGCKGLIMNRLGMNDTMCHKDKVLCTWRSDKDSKNFNEKKFREENPELYAKYLEFKLGSRRFLIK